MRLFQALADGASRPAPTPGETVAVDLTGRWLADHSTAVVLRRGPGPDHRAGAEPAHRPRSAAPAGRRGDVATGASLERPYYER